MLGNLMERKLNVTQAELDGWIIIANIHKHGLTTEDRKEKHKVWNDKVNTEFAAGSAWAHRVTSIFNGLDVEEITKEGSYGIGEMLKEHRETWQTHWAGTEEPVSGEPAEAEEEYDMPQQTECRRRQKTLRKV
jgi:hypothetical protein